MFYANVINSLDEDVNSLMQSSEDLLKLQWAGLTATYIIRREDQAYVRVASLE